MSQSSDAYVEHINSGHYERPDGVTHLPMTERETVTMIEAINLLNKHGLVVVKQDMFRKVQ